MPESKIKLTFLIEPAQAARLKALSERTRVPAAIYVREGIDRVLDLAEKQLRNIDAAVRRQESGDA